MTVPGCGRILRFWSNNYDMGWAAPRPLDRLLAPPNRLFKLSANSTAPCIHHVTDVFAVRAASYVSLAGDVQVLLVFPPFHSCREKGLHFLFSKIVDEHESKCPLIRRHFTFAHGHKGTSFNEGIKRTTFIIKRTKTNFSKRPHWNYLIQIIYNQLNSLSEKFNICLWIS